MLLIRSRLYPIHQSSPESLDQFQPNKESWVKGNKVPIQRKLSFYTLYQCYGIITDLSKCFP